MTKSVSGVRGSFFDFVSDPWKHAGNEQNSARFIQDGLLIIENGKIKQFGPYDQLHSNFPGMQVHHLRHRLILPGFIDGHIHMPQVRAMGSFGHQLLPWLQQWIFPEELKYSDPVYAAEGVKHFFNNLLAAGTTTCQAFTTSNAISTEAFFEEASRRNMRVIAGLVGIDRFAPPSSMNTPEVFYQESKQLIQKWHNNGRNLYAITPRFALGCTPAMLEACRKLKEEFPSVYVNTHISESIPEVRECNSYHQTEDYLSTYEKYNLVGPRFTGGHGIWLTDSEFRRLSTSGAAICFCPTSNLFLGSGMFRLGKAKDPEHPIKLSFGSDVGAGNRFSMLNVLDEAYKVGMCNTVALDGHQCPSAQNSAESDRNRLSPYRAFWSITLGAAESLYLDDKLGNFEVGKEADFVALDWRAGQRAMDWRQSCLVDGEPSHIEEAAKLLFSMMMLGDDRNIDQTWIAGERAYAATVPGELVGGTR